MTSLPVQIDPVVTNAIASGAPVVALESTIIAHGLPSDSAVATARRIEEEVRRSGACPATIAVVDGVARVGLDDEALARVAEGAGVAKASVRDLAVVAARGLTAATTVAATSYLAHLVGIRVFATGGLGGVHRGARETWDVSADLLAVAATPVAVVCAGVKSVLDVPATLEQLESLSVPVLGMGTDTFPGFYVRDTGLPVPWRVDSAAEVADVVRTQDALGLRQGVLVANPVAAEHEMERGLHDATLAAGLSAAERAGVRGKDVTPFLLAWFHEHTDGASVRTNVALVLANAALAAGVAAALAG